MEFKMLLVKFGVFLIYFMKPALLAKAADLDSMELSAFTFLWEDAEARCSRQGQILAPGRRYRAKMIKKLMIKDNVDAVWLYGWRAVSDINPDKDGKLSTLKVDFSRPQKKQLKMICQFDSLYYDPTYKAESTEIARAKCEKDKAKLADVTTEDDVRQITKDMIVDSPHWINSMSSQGRIGYYLSSKIKQCLVAKLVGDDLRYSYEDCSQEYNFICVKGDNIMSSFSPLISLKMARFEEFEEEIEKHAKPMTSSSEMFVLFSSSEMPLESSTIDLPFSGTSTFQPPMTSEVVTPSSPPKITPVDVSSSFQPQLKSADVNSSVQSQITSEGITSSVKPLVTPADFASSVQPIFTSDTATSSKNIQATSLLVYDADTSIIEKIQPTQSYIEMTLTINKTSSSEGGTFSSSPMLKSDPFPITSSIVLPVVSSTEHLVEIFPTSSSDIIDIQATSIVTDTGETKQLLASSSQIIDSSSIDKYYRESVFVEPEISEVTDSFIADMVTTSIAEESSSILIMGDLSTSIFMNGTGFQSVKDTSMKTATETIVLRTKEMISSTSSASYFEIYDIDESEETMTTDSVGMEDDSAILATSASILQTQDIIIQPSLTQTVTSSESETPSHMLIDAITYFTFTPSSQDFMAIESTSSYGSNALAPSSLSIHTTSRASLSLDECTVIDSTTLCGDILTPDSPSTLDVHDSPSSIFNFITPAMTKSMTDAPSTLDVHESSSSIFNFITPAMTKSMTDAPLSSLISTPSYSMNPEDFSNLGSVPSLSSDIPSITDYYYYYNSKEYDTIDEEEEEEQTLPPVGEPTPIYTLGTTDAEETEKIDEELPGGLDEDDMGEDSEVGNASAGTEEVVEKKEDDEDEGIEVGLWVAFAILITLVLIALILAAYLYRKRKLQKSKDISGAAPPAATGETVELRDSRSPSRENGKPRDSATFNDPAAYEI